MLLASSHHEPGARNVSALCKNVRPSHIAGPPLALLAALVALALLVEEDAGCLLMPFSVCLPLLPLEKALLPCLVKRPSYVIASSQLLVVLIEEAECKRRTRT